MRRRIEVTAEDIAAGSVYDACECPVALAFKRAGIVAWVSADGIDLSKEKYDAWKEPPEIFFEGEAVKRFVLGFDNGNPVEPFAFEIDLPEATP